MHNVILDILKKQEMSILRVTILRIPVCKSSVAVLCKTMHLGSQ